MHQHIFCLLLTVLKCMPYTLPQSYYSSLFGGNKTESSRAIVSYWYEYKVWVFVFCKAYVGLFSRSYLSENEPPFPFIVCSNQGVVGPVRSTQLHCYSVRKHHIWN